MSIKFSCLLRLSTLVLLATAACDSRKSMLAPDAATALRTDRAREDHERVKLGAVTFTPNPHMVTAAIARVECSGAITSLQISYESPDADAGRTLRLPVSSCPANVNLLGLLPSKRYHTRIRAWGGNDHEESVLDGPILTTPPMPSDLPSVRTQLTGRGAPGLTAFVVFPFSGRPSYALIVDSIGRVRWYLADSTRSLLDLQPQPNGHYTLTASPTVSTTEFDELDVAGTFLRRWRASVPHGTDVHEFRLAAPGIGLLLTTTPKTMNLQAYGGSSTAYVQEGGVERVDSLGHVLFLWDAFDHFQITDIDPSISLATSTVDWTHQNAIEIDYDGNYLISFRNLSEITKIDSRTGDVIWRWGGVKNQFRFLGDTLKFSFQHGIRRLANGNYILFDDGNTHTPHFSRAVEYRLDQTAQTATLVWSYQPNPAIFSAFLGFAQRLLNGNTLVTFGPQGTLHEVSSSGQLVWKLTAPPRNLIYRAYRIRSLYDPRLVEESLTP